MTSKSYDTISDKEGNQCVARPYKRLSKPSSFSEDYSVDGNKNLIEEGGLFASSWEIQLNSSTLYSWVFILRVYSASCILQMENSGSVPAMARC